MSPVRLAAWGFRLAVTVAVSLPVAAFAAAPGLSSPAATDAGEPDDETRPSDDEVKPVADSPAAPANKVKKAKKRKKRLKENPGIIDIRFWVAGDLAFGGGGSRPVELLSPRSGLMPSVRLGSSWRFELGIEAAFKNHPITFGLGRRTKETVTIITPGFRGYGLVPFAPKFMYSAFRLPILLNPVRVNVALGIGILYQFDDVFSIFLEALPIIQLPSQSQPFRFILQSSLGFALALF